MTSLSPSESAALLFGGLLVVCFAVYLVVRWIAQGPLTPDPWSGQVAEESELEDGALLCQQCLTPHAVDAHFCTHCGGMVGQYTPLIPPLYLYSIGQVFRNGAAGTYRRSVLMLCGFLVVSFAAYALLTPLLLVLPVYWVLVLKSVLARSNRSASAA